MTNPHQQISIEDGLVSQICTPEGQPYAILRWREGALQAMAIKLPDEAWLAVRTEAARHPVLGRCELVCGPYETSEGALDADPQDRPITVFKRTRWSAPEIIPPLAEPGRLPKGGGAAILNVIAVLADQAGIESLRYVGPYPTEGLFDALQASFALGDADAADLVVTCARFTEGVEESALSTRERAPEVDWRPRPFAWLWPGGGVCLQMREGLEAAIVQGRPYTPGRGARRLLQAPCGWEAAVYLADEHWATVARFDASGALVEGPAPLPSCDHAHVGQPLPEAFRAALVRALPPRAPALMQPALARLLSTIPLEWGDAGADEAIIRRDRLMVHAELAVRLRGRSPGAALEALGEAIERPARRRAQQEMAAAWASMTQGGSGQEGE